MIGKCNLQAPHLVAQLCSNLASEMKMYDTAPRSTQRKVTETV